MCDLHVPQMQFLRLTQSCSNGQTLRQLTCAPELLLNHRITYFVFCNGVFHCDGNSDHDGLFHLQGKLLVDIMHEGDMAPPEITLGTLWSVSSGACQMHSAALTCTVQRLRFAGLLEAAMKESTTKKFLIDGFPRAMDQVHAYQEWFGRQGNAVMFFACTEECMTERIMLRGEGREDDNPETIQKRLAKYREVSVAVIEWYRAHTDILKTIDANRPLEVVAADVDAYISGLEGVTPHSVINFSTAWTSAVCLCIPDKHCLASMHAGHEQSNKESCLELSRVS